MGCESSCGCAVKTFELRGNAQQVDFRSKILETSSITRIPYTSIDKLTAAKHNEAINVGKARALGFRSEFAVRF